MQVRNYSVTLQAGDPMVDVNLPKGSIILGGSTPMGNFITDPTEVTLRVLITTICAHRPGIMGDVRRRICVVKTGDDFAEDGYLLENFRSLGVLTYGNGDRTPFNLFEVE